MMRKILRGGVEEVLNVEAVVYVDMCVHKEPYGIILRFFRILRLHGCRFGWPDQASGMVMNWCYALYPKSAVAHYVKSECQ